MLCLEPRTVEGMHDGNRTASALVLNFGGWQDRSPSVRVVTKATLRGSLFFFFFFAMTRDRSHG